MVYVVVTIFTAGLFIFYWIYAIIKDGNHQFEQQQRFEDQLLELLRKKPDADRS